MFFSRFYYKKRIFITYCNIFDGLFDVMTRYSKEGVDIIDSRISDMSDYAKRVWENKTSLRHRSMDSLQRQQSIVHGRDETIFRH